MEPSATSVTEPDVINEPVEAEPIAEPVSNPVEIPEGLQPLEDYTRYMSQRRKSGIPVTLDLGDYGGITKPIYQQMGGSLAVEHSQATDVRKLRTEQFAFEGQYHTVLRGKDLVVPQRYDHLLKFGGVVAPGTDAHLTVFGGQHWERMLMLLGQQVGLDPYKNDLARHVLGRAVKFDRPNVDGTITLSDDLIQYAGLKQNGKVAWVGMIYHAEVHNNEGDSFKDDNYLTSEDVKRIFNLAKP